MKSCTRCKVEAPLEDFHKNSTRKDGLTSWCKQCIRETTKAYFKTEKGKEVVKKSNSGRTEYRRDWWYKKNYNISLDDYDNMRVAQDHRCFICNKHETANGKFLSVDHDHDTGKVRKLLCNPCNQGLGLFLDSPDLLDKAASYLREHGKTTSNG